MNGYSTELTLSEEPGGTRKLFGLLPFIARSLVVGTTLVIDELDAKYDKQYLEGKYVANPYLKTIIDWSDVNA